MRKCLELFHPTSESQCPQVSPQRILFRVLRFEVGSTILALEVIHKQISQGHFVAHRQMLLVWSVLTDNNNIGSRAAGKVLCLF